MDKEKEGSEAAGSCVAGSPPGGAAVNGTKREDRQCTPDNRGKVGRGIKGIAGKRERANSCGGLTSEYLIRGKRERSSPEEERGVREAV